MRRIFFFALLLMFFPTVATAQIPGGARYDGVVLDQTGKPVPNANVRVCSTPATGQPCSPLANVFYDVNLTFPLPNPTTTDIYGNYYFYAVSGTYEVELSGTGITTKQVPDVTVTLPGNGVQIVLVNGAIVNDPNFVNGPNLTWGVSGATITPTLTGVPFLSSASPNVFTGPNIFGGNVTMQTGQNLLTAYNISNTIIVDGSKYLRTDFGIQQAINDAVAQSGSGPGGPAAVYLPPGHYTISTGNILVPAPVLIQGAGRATWLDNVGLPSTNDVFIINPLTDGAMIRFADFMICCTATAGQYPFHLNGATANINNFSVERVLVNQMGNLAVNPNTVVYAEGTSLLQGTPNVSNFNHNIFIGGMIFTNAGDTVRITDSQISFVGKMDVQFQAGGVSSFILERNNFTLPGGVRIGGTGIGAIGCLITENEFETETAMTEPNNSLVDLDGSGASNNVNCVVSNNSFQVLAGLGINANGLRVNWGVSTQVFANRFERGVSPAKDILLTANAVNTLVGTNVWSSGQGGGPGVTQMISAANPNNLNLAAQIGGSFVVNAGIQGVGNSGGISTLDETGTIQPVFMTENTFGTVNFYGHHGTCLLQGVIGASYMCDGNGVSGDITIGAGTGFLPAIVSGTGMTIAGMYFKEIASPAPAAVGADFCYGDATRHMILCSLNSAVTNYHPLRLSEVGTCTMVAGTCTVTWPLSFAVTPTCNATWNGTGTLTGIVKGVPSAANCVITSSIGTDTAVMQVLGTANPN